MKRIRADEALLANLNLTDIALARALIMEGRALAGDRKINSPGEMLPADAVFRVKGEIDAYVSRGAHKLKKAVDVFNVDLNDRVCMDIGASTGGFTDVMLRSGASRVYSIDVGYNLLDYRLRANERVTVFERTNARNLTADMFPVRPEFGATDVSFISLKLILPSVLPVLSGGKREFVALIKPQFEAAKNDVGDKGVVRERRVHESVLKDILSFVPETGFVADALDYSPIRGPEGNIEFLMHLVPEDEGKQVDYAQIDYIISMAYDNFLKSHR